MNFDKDCTTPLAERLIRLYSEYVEGDIDSSGIKYNELIKTATRKDLLYLIYNTPFERESIKIYNILTEQIKVFPDEILEKIAKDLEFIKKMDKLRETIKLNLKL